MKEDHGNVLRSSIPHIDGASDLLQQHFMRSQTTASCAFYRARKVSLFLPSVSVWKVATATEDENNFAVVVLRILGV
jgi:hypothetical protein